MTTRVLLLTCEHGGSNVPPAYRGLFATKRARAALASHRGSDLGALALARLLERRLGAPLHASTTTRLLVDLNRSIGHPHLFSEFSRRLDPSERAAVLDRYYFPHRNAIESWIDAKVRRGFQVLHLGVHSFVPRLEGRSRNADVGLLYDPKRRGERVLCATWKRALGTVDRGLRVRRNYPYRGTEDGLVTHLRKRFAATQYLGIEVESNQALLDTAGTRHRVATAITDSLHAVGVESTGKRG